MSQIEALTGLAVEAILDYTLNSRVRIPQGNQHPYMAPHGVYPCQGEDQWVALAVGLVGGSAIQGGCGMGAVQTAIHVCGIAPGLINRWPHGRACTAPAT
jgi:CoA-transferase family III